MVSTYNGRDDILVDILKGRERIVSHPTTSQFNARRTSTCGLVAMNFASVLLELLQTHGQERLIDVLHAIISKETTEDITSICSEWSNEQHLDMEDIQGIPPFDKSLNRVSTRHGVPNVAYFTRTLQDMQTLRSSAVVIITRPSEAIACAKIMAGLWVNIFVIFDSHPRPSYPFGTGLILTTSIDQAVARLTSILPAVVEHPPGDDLQRQAQLPNNVTSRMFVSNGPPGDVRDVRRSALASGLAVLRLKSEMVDLKQENARLTSKKKSLEGHLKYLEDASSAGKTLTSLQTSSKKFQSVRPFSARFTNSLSGPSWFSHLFRKQASSSSTSNDDHLTNYSSWTTDEALALELELQQSLEESRCYSTASSSSASNDDHLANYSSWTTDEALALELELQHSLEDIQLEAALAASAARNFSCAICMEEQSMDNSVELDCNHPICRDCVRGHIGSKIDERRFPVLCPVCMIEKNAQPAVISGLTVQLIGVDERQYAIWEEMELGQYSVPIHCRRCQRSMSVAREEYEQFEVLICPLPNCRYVWCKACQQPITAGGPPHSCDGTAELDHLMMQQGWKYCPSCRTPVERSEGCNHMTCSPSCGTHFCYACGERIISSALQSEVHAAVTAHYNGPCQMIDDTSDDDEE